MSLNLSDEEIHGLIAYARDKFVTEQYPFAPALRPIRDVLAKLDPKPIPEPPAPKKPYAPSLVLQRKTSGGAESSTKLGSDFQGHAQAPISKTFTSPFRPAARR
jgi:hypothetical protein